MFCLFLTKNMFSKPFFQQTYVVVTKMKVYDEFKERHAYRTGRTQFQTVREQISNDSFHFNEKDE